MLVHPCVIGMQILQMRQRTGGKMCSSTTPYLGSDIKAAFRCSIDVATVMSMSSVSREPPRRYTAHPPRNANGIEWY